MAGGLLNIVAYGNQNVILNGNPKKTFFKTTYAKYTNFGLQKFRVDFDGQRRLRMNEESKFTFRIPRYAELFMDNYVVVTLPTIWSPIFPPQDCSGVWAPYEFKWIENLGSKMIKEISISVGGQTLQRLSGDYLLALVQRDFNNVKTDLYDKMTGNVPELTIPEHAGAKVNSYPNAFFTESPQGAEPSIRSRKLYIPINAWFNLSSKMAFPLVSLQYNQLQIDVIMRPVRELFTIRDVTDIPTLPRVQPNFNNVYHQFYRFLQSPPDISLSEPPTTDWDTRTDWNADIHLMTTYGFLSEEESRVFAANEQKYLFKSVYEWDFKDVTGTQRVELRNTFGMVSDWMFYFQRSDIHLRNEWSNYTNWPYGYIPQDVSPADPSGNYWLDCLHSLPAPILPPGIGPGTNPNHKLTGFHVTGDFNVENHKDILLNLGILLDGKYRENMLDEGVYNYVEKYLRTSGNAPDGLYCYNFCLHTDPFDFQPSGAMNMSKFTNIQLEFNTYVPPLDPSAQFLTICDPSTNVAIGVNKPSWIIYDYNYDLTVLEERYNVLTFVGGNCGLMYAR